MPDSNAEIKKTEKCKLALHTLLVRFHKTNVEMHNKFQLKIWTNIRNKIHTHVVFKFLKLDKKDRWKLVILKVLKVWEHSSHILLKFRE